jgi:hypothetical protein
MAGEDDGVAEPMLFGVAGLRILNGLRDWQTGLPLMGQSRRPRTLNMGDAADRVRGDWIRCVSTEAFASCRLASRSPRSSDDAALETEGNRIAGPSWVPTRVHPDRVSKRQLRGRSRTGIYIPARRRGVGPRHRVGSCNTAAARTTEAEADAVCRHGDWRRYSRGPKE